MRTLAWHWKVGRARKDRKKLILPGIIWCKSSTKDGDGFCLAAGWWDFSISLVIVMTAPVSLKHNSQEEQ